MASLILGMLCVVAVLYQWGLLRMVIDTHSEIDAENSRKDRIEVLEMKIAEVRTKLRSGNITQEGLEHVMNALYPEANNA